MVKILHNVMKSFKEYIETKSLLEVDAPTPPGGAAPGAPGATPGPAGAMPGGPPPGGGISSPIPGGAGGGPPPSLGGGGLPVGDPMSSGGPAPSGNAPSIKLKAYNVWDVLEKLLPT